jgi:hypothetical protein
MAAERFSPGALMARNRIKQEATQRTVFYRVR